MNTHKRFNLDKFREKTKKYRPTITMILILLCLVGVGFEMNSIKNNLQYDESDITQVQDNPTSPYLYAEPDFIEVDLTTSSQVIWSLVNIMFYLWLSGLLFGTIMFVRKDEIEQFTQPA